MDVLSDVLRVVRLTGSVFYVGEFSAPWVLDELNANQIATFAIPDAECMVYFHILMEGESCVEARGLPPVLLESGDVIILPQGDAHRMSSHLGASCPPIRSVLPHASERTLGQIAFGGGGKRSRFICGYLNCDQRFNPLLGALPSLLVVRSRDDYAAVEAIDRNGRRPARMPEGSGAWLGTTLKYTIHEARSAAPGNVAMLGRLTELMFVELLRQYMHQLPAEHAGWLAGLNDAQVGTALRLMHSRPERDWTVEELARESGASRSVLAQRFTEMIGESPMKYLASWRIQLARHLLREGTQTIPQVAERVGYESEAAFNRAFKRAVGSPPAAWRKGALRPSAAHPSAAAPSGMPER